MSKHTSGPWKSLGLAVKSDNTDMVIARTQRLADSYAETLANARLIAASPDLLASLKEIVEARDRHAADGWLPDAYDAIDDYMADVADDAISKAEGEIP